MNIYNEDTFSIFFGDAQSCPAVDRDTPEFKKFLEGLVAKFGCHQLVIQHQVHDVTGYYITENLKLESPASLRELEGDYLITKTSGVAIGVCTADCLPVVFYDKSNKVVAVAHAGWKGTFGEIVLKTLEHMREKHRCRSEDIKVFLGPAAGVCCYQVQEDFLHNIPQLGWRDRVIQKKDDKIFVDLPLYNKLLLIDVGVPPQNINLSFNKCTICNDGYHSNRRNGHARFVQATVVWLR